MPFRKSYLSAATSPVLLCILLAQRAPWVIHFILTAERPYFPCNLDGTYIILQDGSDSTYIINGMIIVYSNFCTRLPYEGTPVTTTWYTELSPSSMNHRYLTPCICSDNWKPSVMILASIPHDVPLQLR